MGESCAGSRAGSVGCSEHHSQRFLSLREVKIAISLLERAPCVSYNPLGGTGPAPEAVSGKNNCQVVFEHCAAPSEELRTLHYVMGLPDKTYNSAGV